MENYHKHSQCLVNFEALRYSAYWSILVLVLMVQRLLEGGTYLRPSAD